MTSASITSARRSAVGGNISGSEATTTTVAVPPFGTTRRRARREMDVRAQEAAQLEALRAATEPPQPEVEASSRATVRGHYGFLHRPLSMAYWHPLWLELRRYEFHWQLDSPCGNVYRFILIERTVDGESQKCVVRGDRRKINPIVDFFDALMYMIMEGAPVREVRFVDEAGCQMTLRFTCKPSLGQYHEDVSEEDKIGWTMEERNARLDVAQTVKLGHAIDIELVDGLSKKTTLLVKGLALQTLSYLLMTSIPSFLNRHDLGVKNLDFLPKDQLTMIRFTFCFFRREMRMTPLDIGELNELLPE